MTELAIQADQGMLGDAADILRWNGVRPFFRGAARDAARELKAHMETSQERRSWDHMLQQPGSPNGNDMDTRGDSANEPSTHGSNGSGGESSARTRSGGRGKTRTRTDPAISPSIGFDGKGMDGKELRLPSGAAGPGVSPREDGRQFTPVASGGDEVRRQDPPQPGNGSARAEKGGDRVCGNCSKKQRERERGAPVFKKCFKGMTTFYCSPKCQKAHWRNHKKTCSPP